ncbi:MAG: hypothetical protein ACR2H5_10540 [Ktedonobacteraceae bacterium]
MYTREYEFTAVHEAGHAVCIAHFPPANTALASLAIAYPEMIPERLKEIEIWYDKEKERYDGRTCYSPYDLKYEQSLFIALGGRVAEWMVTTDETWDITAIQKELFSGKFEDTQDMDDIYKCLEWINKDHHMEKALTTTLSRACSALAENWKLVLQVASELLSTYEPVARVAKISYDNLLSATKAQLMQLRD